MKRNITTVLNHVVLIICLASPLYASSPWGTLASSTSTAWTELADPWNDNYANQIWEIKTGPDGRLYVASNGGLVVSSDGGATWTAVGSLTGVTAFSFNTLGEPVAANVTGAANVVAVYRYTGGQWVPTAGVKASLRVTEITNDSTGALVCSTAWGGNVFRSTDDGNTWTEITVPWSGGALWTITCGPDGTLYTGGELTTGLWATTNEGASWTDVGFTSAQGFTNNLYSVAFDENGSPLVASTQHNDGDPISRLVSGAPDDAGIGLPIYTNVHKIVVDPTGAITVGVVGGLNSEGIYQSTDNGATWSALGSGFPNGGAETVAEDASLSVYVNVNLGNHSFALYKMQGNGPLPPSNLSIDSASLSPINMSWQRNGGLETGFIVSRSLDDATWSTVATLPPGTLEYSDSSVSPGTTYFYRVAALTGNWQTPFSNVVSNAISQPIGPAHHFLVATPGQVTAGLPFTITATALNVSRGTAVKYRGTVHFTSTDPGGALPADTKLALGVGTFEVTLNSPGIQKITASDLANSLITGTSSPILVVVGATHYLVTAPGRVTAGLPFTCRVAAINTLGTVATNYNGTVHFTSTDPAAQLPADATLTHGAATFQVTLSALGAQEVSAADLENSEIAGTSGPVFIVIGATHFQVSVPSKATVGHGITFRLRALRANGQTSTKYSGMVHFTSDDPKAQLPPDTLVTNGVGAFAATFHSVGKRTIKATDKQISAITGTSEVTVFPGP